MQVVVRYSFITEDPFNNQIHPPETWQTRHLAGCHVSGGCMGKFLYKPSDHPKASRESKRHLFGTVLAEAKTRCVV